MTTDDYLHGLRFALSRQANAYGFTLVVWGTGALAACQLGKLNPADVFAYIGGALVSICLIVALVFGVRRPFRMNEPARQPFSGMHLLSVPVALAAGWGVTLLVGGVAGYFLSALVAVALYQLLLAVEVGLALVACERADADQAVHAGPG